MSDLFADLVASLERIGLGRRLQAVLAGGVALVLIWTVYGWSTGREYVTAFSDMELETVNQVTQRLDEAGVAYRLGAGGSRLRVPATEVARVRVLLAEEGIPSPGRPGMELFDRSSWGMTDFTQKVNYRRALEGELGRTLAEMRRVESAKVHLALHESDVFRDEDQPGEASVVLTLARGTDADRRMVEGVTSLIASSVDGLDSRHVTVLDDDGRVLSTSAEGEGAMALSSRQLEMRREVESHLEEKARQLLGRVVGPGNADVRVSAELDFDQRARTVRSVDPENQVLMEEERAEIIPSDSAPGAASIQTHSDFDASRSVERYTKGVGGIDRLTVSVLVNEAAGDGGDAARAASAGGGGGGAAPAPDTERIRSLVAGAVGLDPDRGDVLNVVRVPFDAPAATGGGAPPEGGPGVWQLLQRFQKPLLGLLAALLTFFLATRVLRSIRHGEPAAALPGGEGDDQGLPAGSAEDAGEVGSRSVEGEGEREALPGVDLQEKAIEGANREARRRVSEQVMEEPEVAAQVARTWMKEGTS